MKRVLSLYLPMWSIDLVRRRLSRSAGRTPAGAPREALPAILLVNTVADRQIVACCCEQAAAAGVQPGMTLAHARAMADQGTKGSRDRGTEGRKGTKGRREQTSDSAPSSLRPSVPSSLHSLHPFTPQRDAAALRALAEWATRFAPTVSPDAEMAALASASGSHSLGPGTSSPGPSSLGPFLLHTGLVLDVTGCTRLYGSEEKLLQQLLAAVTRLGFRCRAAIAPTIGGAWALARFGPHPMTIVQDDGLLAALASLPVRALRVDEDVLNALAEVAVDRIEHLLALPRDMLPSRFGDDLLLRLDQALGQAMETIDPVRPTSPASVEFLFAGPATQVQAIRQAARRLVEELAVELRRRESGARQLDLTLFRADAEPVRLSSTFGRPSRDARHFWSLLSPQLEQANLGHGVDRMRLAAPRLGRLRHEQAERWRDNDAATDAQLAQELGQLIDVLTNRLGPAGVLEVEAVATHQPARAFRFREGKVEERRRKREGNERQSTASEAIARLPETPPGSAHAGAGDRPSLLLEHPEPIEVWALTPDGPPVLLHWRGREHRVMWSVGPLRIADEWWRSTESGFVDTPQAAVACCDYFKVADDWGRWLWVSRSWPSGRWLLRGMWV